MVECIFLLDNLGIVFKYIGIINISAYRIYKDDLETTIGILLKINVITIP